MAKKYKIAKGQFLTQSGCDGSNHYWKVPSQLFNRFPIDKTPFLVIAPDLEGNLRIAAIFTKNVPNRLIDKSEYVYPWINDIVRNSDGVPLTLVQYLSEMSQEQLSDGINNLAKRHLPKSLGGIVDDEYIDLGVYDIGD